MDPPFSAERKSQFYNTYNNQGSVIMDFALPTQQTNKLNHNPNCMHLQLPKKRLKMIVFLHPQLCSICPEKQHKAFHWTQTGVHNINHSKSYRAETNKENPMPIWYLFFKTIFRTNNQETCLTTKNRMHSDLRELLLGFI